MTEKHTFKRLDNYRQIIKDCFPDNISSIDELVEYIKKYMLSDIDYGTFMVPESLSDIIVSIYECYDISGYSITQLPKTHKLCADTLFLASTAFEQPSVNAKYSDISSQCLDDISAKLKKEGYLHTMAYEEPQHFSLSSHNHNELYTEDLTVEYSDFINTYDSSELSIIGKVSITKTSKDGFESKREYPIKCPKLKYPPPSLNQHAIGALMFLPLSDIQTIYKSKMKSYGNYQNIDIDADDFNGWVFPNGTTFSCGPNDFTLAKKAFGKEVNTSFTVPNLNMFFYAITQFQQNKKPLGVRQQRCILGPHNHDFRITGINGKIELDGIEIDDLRVTTSGVGMVGEIDANIPVPYFSSSPDYTMLETRKEETSFAFDKNVSMRLDMQTAIASINGTYYPKHQLMPVMMYIGPKKVSIIDY